MTDRREGIIGASAVAEALSVPGPVAAQAAAPAMAPAMAPAVAPSRLAWLGQGLARAGWAPSGVFLIHLLLDQGLHLYGRYEWLDMPMHLVGGVAISFFMLACWRAALKQGIAGRPAPWLTPLLVWLGTFAAAVLWEFAEFGSDRLIGTRVQSSVEDTLSDILLGLIGGLVVALASWRRAAAPSPSLDTESGSPPRAMP